MLALDIGSSSVKAAVLESGAAVTGPVRVGYRSRFTGVRAEIDPPTLLAAVRRACGQATGQAGQPAGQVGQPAGQVGQPAGQAGCQAAGQAVTAASRPIDLVAFATLSPSWIALDRRGEPLTPLVTHADRRSVEQARELERRIGARRLLAITGNRPFPGGIASTTWAWYCHNAPEVMRRADLVGQLSTYLLRRCAGVRAIDPSNAGFLGVYDTANHGGWVASLVAAVGGRESQLPEILPADAVAGRLNADGADLFGVATGTPVLTGCIDGSAAMLAAGAVAGGLRAGQLVEVVGSTDVLAMCVDRPRPHERLLTRPLGVGRRWVSVATVASSGSTLEWVRRTFFADQADTTDITGITGVTDATGTTDTAGAAGDRFYDLVAAVAAAPDPGGVRFAPYLAGERTALEQPTGGFTGLTLATTREHLVSAVVEALAAASAQRLPRLADVGTPLSTVYTTGGGAGTLGAVVHRDWPPAPNGDRWRFVPMAQATLAGLGTLVSRAT